MINYLQTFTRLGVLGKITSFKETEDNRYLIELKGLIRFEIIRELILIKNIENLKLDLTNFIVI